MKPAYVGFWKRALSKILDIMLLGLVTYALHGFSWRTSSGQGQSITEYLSLACFYYSVSWWKFSGTLGNYLLGQRVVSLRLDKPTPKEVAVRTAVVLLSECLLSLPFLTVGFDPRKQGLHDKLAGTFVIEAHGAPSAQLADCS